MWKAKDYPNRTRTKVSSKNLNPPLTKEERLRFELDDEVCFATVYVAHQGPAKKSLAQKVVTDKAIFSEKLNSLSAVYEMGDDVKEFIAKNDFLFQPLFQAVEPLKIAFGGLPKLRLDLINEGRSGQLFVLIATSDDPERALEKLGTFDRDWWFDVPHGIHEILEFTLEFI